MEPAVTRCNVYGAETASGHANPYGGLTPAAVTQVVVLPGPGCSPVPVGVRQRAPPAQIVDLCEQHYAEMMGLGEARVNGQRLPIPWNVRRDVQVCPRCASLAPDCRNPDQREMGGQPGRCGCQETKVAVRLVSVS